MKTLCIALFLTVSASLAEQPLPGLKIEATDGGSVFVLSNGASQALTAYLIELVDYPGSSFAMSKDEIAAGAEALGAGKVRRIPNFNMTLGAAPDYVKVMAAIYADGSSSGSPEKVGQLIGRRKLLLATVRDAAGRLEKALADGASKDAVSENLMKWVESIPVSASKTKRAVPLIVDQAVTREFVAGVANRLKTDSLAQSIAALRAVEQKLAAAIRLP